MSSTVASPSTVRTFAVIRPSIIALKAALIGAAMAGSILAGAIAFHAASLWTMGICFVIAISLSVWAQHAAAEEIHDGAHNKLATTVPASDRIGGVYASLIGISFAVFKVRHYRHHSHFGDPRDPDYANYATCPRGIGGWIVYVLTMFSGYAAIRAALTRPPESMRADESGAPVRSWQHPIGTAVVQLTLWGITAMVATMWWYPLCWVLPLITVTYGLTAFRTLLEHYCEPGSPHADPNGKAGAIYDLGGRVQAQIFAAQYGYNYHGTHHCLPSVPNYALHQVSALDAERLPRSTRQIIQSTYWRRVRELMQLSMK